MASRWHHVGMAAKKRARPRPADEDRDDPNVMAHRILREATGEAPKTLPAQPPNPSEPAKR